MCNAADHQAIVQTAKNFVTYIEKRDAKQMAGCCWFVCEISNEQNDKLDFFTATNASYARDGCKYLLDYYDCVQTLEKKCHLFLSWPDPHESVPAEKDLSNWVQAIARCNQISSTLVSRERCLEYRLQYGGKKLTQRFVNVKGTWYLGSVPFADVRDWDATRKDDPVFRISAHACQEISSWLRAVKRMAERGASKEVIDKYLQDRYMSPTVQVLATNP
jgi:hypothetical protein